MVATKEYQCVRPILVIEDNEEDYETTVRAFKKVGVTNPISHCENGDDALDYLHHRGHYVQRGDASQRPGIILLDLNMPGTDGFEVLADIKRDKSLRNIPVVILTTSSSDTDVERGYDAGASSYMQKPLDMDGFVEAIRRFKDYWFETVILP